jgi:hypothetical protein
VWRSVEYKEVYLRAYDSIGRAPASLGRYLHFYNRKRPHSCLDAGMPARAYFSNIVLGANGLDIFRRGPVITNRRRFHLSGADSGTNKPAHLCWSTAALVPSAKAELPRYAPV